MIASLELMKFCYLLNILIVPFFLLSYLIHVLSIIIHIINSKFRNSSKDNKFGVAPF